MDFAADQIRCLDQANNNATKTKSTPDKSRTKSQDDRSDFRRASFIGVRKLYPLSSQHVLRANEATKTAPLADGCTRCGFTNDTNEAPQDDACKGQADDDSSSVASLNEFAAASLPDSARSRAALLGPKVPKLTRAPSPLPLPPTTTLLQASPPASPSPLTSSLSNFTYSSLQCKAKKLLNLPGGPSAPVSVSVSAPEPELAPAPAPFAPLDNWRSTSGPELAPSSSIGSFDDKENNIIGQLALQKLHRKQSTGGSLAPQPQPPPPAGALKPSASTSCLVARAKDDQGTDKALTSASLTHEWKKLKTPNKCRECNLLVYFNGRECCFCGFVAHKKCANVLVIKCSGQRVVSVDHSSSSAGSAGSSGGAPPAGGWRQAFKTIGGVASGGCAQAVAPASDFREELGLLHQQLLLKQHPRLQPHRPTPGSSFFSLHRTGKQPLIKPIYGQPLLDSETDHLVDFIKRFVYEVETRGLTLKGIYRVSSIKSKVDKLCNYYDQNLSSLIDLSSFHPSIIANALKMYLRELPEPLLTHKLYGQFIELAKKYSSSNYTLSTLPLKSQQQTEAQQTVRSTDSKTPSPPKTYYCLLSSSTTTHSVYNDPAYNPLLIVEIKEILDLMPNVNKSLVAIIMRHLRRVAEMSDQNQMNAKNLSIIFGPTLLRADDESAALADNIHQARIVEIMITWAEQIFPQYENYESKAVIELNQ